MEQRRRWQVLAVLGIISCVAVIGASLPTDDWVLALANWIRGAGAVGAVAFFGVYAMGAVLLLPGSLLTLTAGFAYGPIGGTLIAWPAATLAATVAFVVGRFVARGWVQRRIAMEPRFAAVDRAIGRDGFKVVLLLRLSPIFPFNLLNYGLGLTSVPLHHYVGASLLGMLPGAALFAYLGSLVTTAAALANGAPDGGPAKWILYAIGLGATVGVTILLTRIARRELAKSLRPPETEHA